MLAETGAQYNAGIRIRLGSFPALMVAVGFVQAQEAVHTSITVADGVQVEAPGAVRTVAAQEIRSLPGAELDDKLRTLPGFTLFRHASSLAAHPTTQGVSLRGIGGASGASRTLVLWDGIPMNDPFGGWVYWDRVAPSELDRLEVSPGASTSAFGDLALGGVVSLFSREPSRHHLEAAYEAGSVQQLEGAASNLWARWAFSSDGRAFKTGGYFIIPRELRGAVDQKAGVEFVSGVARVDWLGGSSRLFVKADILAESRRNGTALQHNSTGLGEVAVHYAHESARDGVSVIAYVTQEQFHSTFSAIAPDRNSERLTLRQRVPAEAEGGSVVWQHRGKVFQSIAGGDATRDQGFSDETAYPSGARRRPGGMLVPGGGFAQFEIATAPVRLFAGARVDSAPRRAALTPSAGLVTGAGRWRVRGAVYRGFRAPTLNELYRDFRVGNVNTLANAALRPERLLGAECGFDFRTESSHLSVTGFRNQMSDLIFNATLGTTPNLILRQRQNLAGALGRGAELGAEHRWGPLALDARYLFVDSRLSLGVPTPQVPRHQGSAQATYSKRGTLVALSAVSYSLQFEDERNQTRAFLEPGFATVQLLARQQLTRTLSAMLAIENALDRRYVVGFTPTPNVGPSRLWRAGLRWQTR